MPYAGHAYLVDIEGADKVVKGGVQLVQQLHDSGRRDFLAKACETDNVCKHDGHLGRLK